MLKGTTGALCPATRGLGAPVVLGRGASLIVSMGVVTHTLWTSAAPAMVYALYAEQWHLSHTVTTGIFAIYPSFVVAVLVLFGDLSDHIGRRATMLLGLGASLAGSLLFAVAPDVGWLFTGRALMGIGVGLTAGPSTAAVAEFVGEGPSKRAALLTTIAQAVGFSSALLLGGALVQYAPWPMRLSFWVLTALLALLFTATWFLPRCSNEGTGMPWRPSLPCLPRGVRKAFATAALAMMTAYTHGVLILSLGGQVAMTWSGHRTRSSMARCCRYLPSHPEPLGSLAAYFLPAAPCCSARSHRRPAWACS